MSFKNYFVAFVFIIFFWRGGGLIRVLFFLSFSFKSSFSNRPFPSIPFVHPLLLFTIIIHFLSHFSPDDLIRPFYPTKEIPSDLSNFPPADK